MLWLRDEAPSSCRSTRHLVLLQHLEPPGQEVRRGKGARGRRWDGSIHMGGGGTGELRGKSVREWRWEGPVFQP